MPKKRRTTKQNRSIFAGTSIGLVVSAIISILGITLIALLIENEYISNNTLNYFVIVINLISVFIGAYTSGKLTKVNKQHAIIICGVGYLFILLTVKFLFFSGTFCNGWTTTVCTLIATAVALVLAIRPKHQPKTKRIRANFR